jgi:hypothetical protein
MTVAKRIFGRSVRFQAYFADSTEKPWLAMGLLVLYWYAHAGIVGGADSLDEGRGNRDAL